MVQPLNIIIKTIALIAILIIISTKASAQTLNNGIFFQAVARDNFSNPAMNRKIYVQSSIIQTTATGTIVLTEEFQTTTDATGIFSISVGQGMRIGGTVSNLTGIDWAKGPYFLSLKIAITPIAPATTWEYKSEWINLGTTSFGAVPYALYAGTAAGLNDKLNITDTSGMLAFYVKTNTIKILETIIGSKIASTDTAVMLAPYKKMVNEIIASNITSLTADAINAALDSKVSLVDSNNNYVTPTQLAAKTFDINPINSSIATKLNIADSINNYVTPTQLAAKNFDISPINISIATKVDKIAGKALSSNDYTNTEKIKLAEITGINTGDQDLSNYPTFTSLDIKLNISDTAIMLSDRIKRDTTSLSNRINLKAGINDLIDGLDLKVDKQTGKLLSSNDFTNTEKTKLSGITGINTGDQDLSSYATKSNLIFKLNILDTAEMLSNRINRDTNSLSNRIDNKLNIIDTSVMLNNRFNKDTVSLSNRINLKANSSDVTSSLNLRINISDTALMLSNRIHRDTSFLSNRINLKANSSDVITNLALKANTTDLTSNLNLKINISDTALMLSNRIKRDTTSLSNRINLKANSSDVVTDLALKANTTDLTSNLNLKVNFSDTALMLSNRFKRDTASLSNRINLKANSSDVLTDLALKVNTTDLIAELDLKIDKQTGKILSTNDYTNTEKAKLAAISGNNTGDQDLSSYATNSNLNLKINFTDTALMLSNRIKRDTTSLSDRINLKANSSDIVTDLVLKANTTDLIAGLDLKVDKQTGKILSSNDYTNIEKGKLAAISGNNTGDQDLSSYATNSNLAFKLNILDTTAMLSNRINRDTTALSNRINLKANTTDVVNELLLKQAIITSGTTSQFYRGDKTWQTINYATIGAAPTAGSNSITSLGTITSGTWNATTIAVANGGTGATSLTANGVLIGNATSAVTTVAPSTNGNVLTSNGTSWISSTPSVSLIREIANEFSATTSQTSFTLTQTPSVNSKVKMYINGVRISNSAYSVSGATLTYNATNNGAYTLTASDRIQFDYYY